MSKTRTSIVLLIALAFVLAVSNIALGSGVSATKYVVDEKPYYVPGEFLDYRMTLTNINPKQITNNYTEIYDMLPNGTRIDFPSFSQAYGDTEYYDLSEFMSGQEYEVPSGVSFLENFFYVRGTDVRGQLTNVDVSHIAIVVNPRIDIEKSTNGADADEPTGPLVLVGSTVTWTYVVRNTGDVPLSDVIVTDSETGVNPSYISGDDDDGELDTNETWTYRATGTAVAGQYSNVGTVTAKYVNVPSYPGEPIREYPVSDSDPSHYFGANPKLSIVKTGAWVDGNGDGFADPGELINYSFLVTNEGNVTLTGVVVTDTVIGPVGGPVTLAVGASQTFTASYAITQADIDAGFKYNVATADSDQTGPETDDHREPLPQNASIDIEKLVNGQDADTAPGVMVVVGDAVTFEFKVTNTGNITLNNVTINDDTYGPIGTIVSLAPGASQTFTLNKYAEEYQHTNIATVTTNEGATDSDAGNYYGQPGDEGLSPGYWKNHEEDWVCWDPDDNITLMFPEVTKWYGLETQTLMDTLSRKIKQTESNAPSILLRQAVAAVLNACHPNINYPKSAEWIISEVTHELNEGTYASMLVLAGQLDIWNNLEGDISK